MKRVLLVVLAAGAIYLPMDKDCEREEEYYRNQYHHEQMENFVLQDKLKELEEERDELERLRFREKILNWRPLE